MTGLITPEKGLVESNFAYGVVSPPVMVMLYVFLFSLFTMAFMVINSSGQPIYELDMSGRRSDESARASQLIIHAALDSVDASVWASKETFMKVVERHNEQLVSAYVTSGGLRLMLLSEARNEAQQQAFFQEAHELLVKVNLNPFFAPGTKIIHRDFDSKVKGLARRHLGYRGE